MKKLIAIVFLVSMMFTAFSQGIFKPVDKNLFTNKDKARGLKAGTTFGAWQWRFDATIAVTEFTWMKESKQFSAAMFSAIGPSIGYQHYVPTSATDVTPFNNYGVSAAVLVGESVYNPNFAALKVAVIANLFQYFKAGVSYTPNATDHFGILIGGGITF